MPTTVGTNYLWDLQGLPAKIITDQSMGNASK